MRRAIRTTGMLLVVCLAALRAPAGESQLSLVPWKVLDPGAEPLKNRFTLFWIPASPEAMRHSGLITSRRLLFYSGRCVGMHVVRVDDGVRLSKLGAAKAPLAIFVDGESEIARVATDAAGEVEAMVRVAFDTREALLSSMLNDASAKASAGDSEKAVVLYRAVAAESCAFPRLAKTAQRALRRLGARD